MKKRSPRFFCTIIIIQLFAFSALQGQKARKKIVTWYIYEKGSSFSELEPQKDIIRSISIFGNPPREFIENCHRNNIEVYHAVSGNEETINAPDKIKNTADLYYNDCISNGYDGIDLDFENLDPDFQKEYGVFLMKVSAKLHKGGKKLSHCVGYYPNLYKKGVYNVFYEPRIIAKTCDLVRVMCYDMYYSPGKSDKKLMNRDDCQGIGPTSNYSFTKEAMTFWSNYISRDKLVMALPAYSNDYTLVPGGIGKQVYSPVPDSIAGTLPSPIWQWYEKINLYIYNDKIGNPHLFFASDNKSTKALLELGDDLKIYNIGFWHLSAVNTDLWEVVREWIKK